jgi:hypothetical protein
LDAAFLASVREHGVLQPVTVSAASSAAGAAPAMAALETGQLSRTEAAAGDRPTRDACRGTR